MDRIGEPTWSKVFPWYALGKLHKPMYIIQMRRGRKYSTELLLARAKELQAAAQNLATQLVRFIEDLEEARQYGPDW